MSGGDADVESTIAEQLTGLCTFLVQGDDFHDGDSVDLVFRRDDGVAHDVSWLPLRCAGPNEEIDALSPGERTWGEETVLVRATLSRTGGRPRDSMNQPGNHQPEALTLSDVRVRAHSPEDDETGGYPSSG